MSLNGKFSGFGFAGKTYATRGWGQSCTAAVYMARAPLTLAEVERQERMEALGEGTWVKMRPVAELKKLIEAAKAAGKGSRGQAPGARRPAPSDLQVKGR